MRLTEDQQERADGILTGCAVGDVLGIPWEFKPPQDFTLDGHGIHMPGGGPFGFDPGEWSDDTAMTLAVADAAAEEPDLFSPRGLEKVAQNFLAWYGSRPKDVGGQIHSVLCTACAARHRRSRRPAWKVMGKAARTLYKRTGGDGNGSLMRTGAVALAHLDDPRRMGRAAFAVSALTHAGRDSMEACMLWSRAIREAVLSGDPEAGMVKGLAALPLARRIEWAVRLNDAERGNPQDFPNNGWVVHAVQAAWSAVHVGLGYGSYDHGIEAAISCGHDTDTVGAIAGALLGATFGVHDIWPEWRQQVHGWPTYRAADLVSLSREITARRGWTP